MERVVDDMLVGASDRVAECCPTSELESDFYEKAFKAIVTVQPRTNRLRFFLCRTHELVVV